MTAAEFDWLDLRAPYDDLARRASQPLCDRMLAALSRAPGRPLVVLDIGAGTGNSMRWFEQHLLSRVRGRPIHRVLVDADAASLGLAASRLGPNVRSVVGSIAAFPAIAATVMDEVAASRRPVAVATGDDPAGGGTAEASPVLLLTGSALLDVLGPDDITAIVETLHRFSGLALFLLSVSGQWTLAPAHSVDESIGRAFDVHQRRESRLGSSAAEVLAEQCRRIGAHVETSGSDWHLRSPQDSSLLTRFLTERVAAAVEAVPSLSQQAGVWLDERLATMQDQTNGLPTNDAADGDAAVSVVIEHTDVFVDATATMAGFR